MILRTIPVEMQYFRMKSARNPLMGTSRANSMYGMAEKTPSNTIDCKSYKKVDAGLPPNIAQLPASNHRVVAS